MNKFEEAYWDGARDASLAILRAVEHRTDIPVDVRTFVFSVLRETGNRKNSHFLEQLGIQLTR
jgi:hypothetical protein